MSTAPNVVAIIPVRGGDPETPPEGMVQIAGRPLLAFTIDAARQSRYIRRIVVSTDDERIAGTARELGADVPVLRPAALAARDVPLGQVLQHAVNWLDANDGGAVDLIAFLEMTHPVRPAGLIDKVIDVVIGEQVDSAFAVREERHEFWTFDAAGSLNRVRPHSETTRSALQPLYKEMGGLVTVMRADVARSGQRLGEHVGIVPVRDLSSAVDLHDEGGLRLAELLLGS